MSYLSVMVINTIIMIFFTFFSLWFTKWTNNRLNYLFVAIFLIMSITGIVFILLNLYGGG